MIKYTPSNQLTLEGFQHPFDQQLSPNNRWVILATLVPWNELAGIYAKHLRDDSGRYSVDIRTVIAALIIKHKLSLSDRDTVAMVSENIYMQYFCGYPSFQSKPPFDASLFVDIRKRMGHAEFKDFNDQVIQAYQKHKRIKGKPSSKTKRNHKDGSGKAQVAEESSDKGGQKAEQVAKNKGKLKLDATIADQYIKYPTDLNLLNESRENAERLIDLLCKTLGLKPKPRTYRRVARREYLNTVKKKRKTRKQIARGIKAQLQYLNRDIKIIHQLLDRCEAKGFPFKKRDQRIFWVIQLIYDQQKYMYDNKVNRCDDRIVNIYQPYVRPMVRGKDKAKVEFGSKLSVSEVDGFTQLDCIHWNGFNESKDLVSQVENYRSRYGFYPEVVIVDGIYLNRDNRKYLKLNHIRSNGKPLGRPQKQHLSYYQKRKRKKEAALRNHIEAKFGQAKNGYRLNQIRARRKDTSESWISAIFFVMNLVNLVKLSKKYLSHWMKSLKQPWVCYINNSLDFILLIISGRRRFFTQSI